ncbi:hypothetical protein FB45DRAFT_1023124 [Roridomyces roridus]|uniref:Uncharacterized protein n=1 Tax=Roridomyces roridus TaxID=1738132 RepID=A0AAD7C5J8_9AGAR|nr:hypothetical protein FB45DRAFT_1023124 [Roridomyces roridus]
MFRIFFALLVAISLFIVAFFSLAAILPPGETPPPRSTSSAFATIPGIASILFILAGTVLITTRLRSKPARICPDRHIVPRPCATRPPYKSSGERNLPRVARSSKFIPVLSPVIEHPWVPFTFDGAGFIESLKSKQANAARRSMYKISTRAPRRSRFQPPDSSPPVSENATKEIPIPPNMLPGAIIYETPPNKSRTFNVSAGRQSVSRPRPAPNATRTMFNAPLPIPHVIVPVVVPAIIPLQMGRPGALMPIATPNIILPVVVNGVGHHAKTRMH